MEEYARFKIPKFLRAFLDVLYVHAYDTGLADVIRVLPDLELWLELEFLFEHNFPSWNSGCREHLQLKFSS
jgi:hypothetical protein